MTPAELSTVQAHRATLAGYRTEFFDLAREIADQYGVTLAEITSKTRGSKHVCAARDMLCMLACDRGMGQNQVGRFLGRNHTSVRSACIRMREALNGETPTD